MLTSFAERPFAQASKKRGDFYGTRLIAVTAVDFRASIDACFLPGAPDMWDVSRILLFSLAMARTVVIKPG
jgi:hypothetical protein